MAEIDTRQMLDAMRAQLDEGGVGPMFSRPLEWGEAIERHLADAGDR